jgi:hypothetical protein
VLLRQAGGMIDDQDGDRFHAVQCGGSARE